VLPVLYYHRVGPFRPGAERKMNVTPETFRKHMRYLRWRKYAFVTLDEAMAAPAKKSVAVTFDDGYRDLMEHALPLLDEMRIPATFFIVAGAVGKTDAWYRAEERIMEWDDVRELLKRGHAVGSHTMTHAPLTKIAAGDARREIAESKRVLEDKLGAPMRHFAYPQGLNSPELRDVVREAGYAAGWATKSGDGSNFARRRFRVPADLGVVRFGLKMLKIRAGYY
jgi:peptidoglycan/xylan/chitin deacetylase (PgdA/CDA1 family)